MTERVAFRVRTSNKFIGKRWGVHYFIKHNRRSIFRAYREFFTKRTADIFVDTWINNLHQ